MRFAALSVVLVVLLCLGAAPVVADEAPSAHEGLTASAAVSDEIQPNTDGMSTLTTGVHDTPSTEFVINLQSNRDADWVVTVEYELETESQREAFSTVAAEFEDGTAPQGGLSVDLYENIAGFASEETGREMAIEDVDRTSSLDGNTGTLRLSFTWSQFLEEDGERLVFNDALQTPQEGTWLTSLSENQELRITTPRGYAITSANVGFTDNTVTIEGPHTFDQDEHVRITLEPSAFAGTTWELLGAAAVVGAAIIGGALLLRRRDTEQAAPTTTPTDSETTAATPEPADPETPPADEPVDPPEDLSLLADDERVLRLLEDNGGRMRQADIVSETDWSDAKVSQLLSSMADDDRITKLRIGRENLISLPDVDALDGSKRDENE